MRKFGQLKVHEGKHSMTVHTFNPYADREDTPSLDRAYFDNLLNAGGENCDLNIEHCFTGCLDAPEYIPLGGSERITTLGGWEREEYMNAPRDQTDWKAAAVVEYECAQMLKEILEEST